jgi:hypothetical protein
MKKILGFLVLIITVIFISGCTDYDDLVYEFGGEDAYTQLYEWYLIDEDENGEYSEEEIQNAIELVEEDYGSNKILLLDIDSNNGDIYFCLDSTMDRDYIEASVEGLEVWDEFQFVDLYYILDDDCYDIEFDYSDYNFLITTITEEELYDIYYESYLYSGYSEEDADLMASEDAEETIAVNYFNIDWDNLDGDYAYINTSQIFLKEEAMEELTLDEKYEVIIHELGHTFGLNDIYDDQMSGYSIMYGYANNGSDLDDLTYFDITNIEMMYSENSDLDNE